MKQSNRATAASLGCRKREAEIAGNVSRNMKIRQTLQSSGGMEPEEAEISTLFLYVLRISKIRREKQPSNLQDASS